MNIHTHMLLFEFWCRDDTEYCFRLRLIRCFCSFIHLYFSFSAQLQNFGKNSCVMNSRVPHPQVRPGSDGGPDLLHLLLPLCLPHPHPQMYSGADSRPQISSSVNISLVVLSETEEPHYFTWKTTQLTGNLLHRCWNPHEICLLHLVDAPWSLSVSRFPLHFAFP